MSVTHKFVSAAADGADPTLLQPSNWNDTHTVLIDLTADVTGTLPVNKGGTGAASETAYAVICGGTTSTNPLQAIAGVGASGQVLTSNGAGVLPTFQAAAGGVSMGKVVAASLNWPLV